MATTNIFVYLFAILASSAIIHAQETSEVAASETSSSVPNDETTLVPAATSSASGIFDQFPFKAVNFDFKAFWPGFNSSGFLGFGSRRKRSPAEDTEVEEHSREKRSVVRCNFRTQGGFRCIGCRQVRRCYPFNLATITTCSGFFGFCNNGICSRTGGPLCRATTSTTSTSSSSSTTDSTSTSSSTTGSSSTSSTSTTDSTSSSSSTTGSSSSSTTDSTSSSSSTTNPTSSSSSTTAPTSSSSSTTNPTSSSSSTTDSTSSSSSTTDSTSSSSSTTGSTSSSSSSTGSTGRDH